MNICKKENMTLISTEKKVGCGYHHCVQHGPALGYVAFHTDDGLSRWLNDFGLSIELVHEGTQRGGDNDGGWYKIYRIVGSVGEAMFRSIDQIPDGARRVKDLSNGSMVDCYIATVDGLPTMFRPNPNDKDIYKPLPLDQHIAISLSR